MTSDTHSKRISDGGDKSVEDLYSRLDILDAARLASDLVAYTPTLAEVEDLFERTREVMGTAASLPVIKRVASRNPDTVHAFGSLGQHSIDRPKADGFICWLPLTEAGRTALLDFSFDPADPAPEFIAGQHGRPAAIYIWGIFGPGRGTAGLAWAFQRWSTPHYRDADIYVRAATPSGLRLYKRVGFEPVYPNAEQAKRDLVVFRREPAVWRPAYDTYPSRSSRYSITVVRTHDDLAKVLAIRAAVYMSEQVCPYDEEYDGNDFSSTHLLGYVGDEPAATIRIRCFAGFAKVERLAVRREHRRSRLAVLMIQAAKELGRMKGYTRLYGHARKHLIDLWAVSGARPIPDAPGIAFSDFDYVPMLLETDAHPDAVTLDSDPYKIIRPEGRWHAEGILERSNRRPPKAPPTDPPEAARERPRRQSA